MEYLNRGDEAGIVFVQELEQIDALDFIDVVVEELVGPVRQEDILVLLDRNFLIDDLLVDL